ncbi:Electron transfer flavoprotein alpha/beta-subunit [Pseudopedobacter saltans DSM 12145]|uniref:Electron transfer flavoprotein subunit beta n=1 Tax=Pseudopedobacter saltans (strain ATCC 51119 / DSM 12145 / JCM 21818 / CCUG 39354 / LMG 10337 / NBRC 100064 / NCIMB 13643) TaxID=762903 RepID=F0S948_PSESL|nr:electron transfer flavoprotein subunit beta/FixA family protein [Pseudopedobacter saltans]ADY51346.1 Electron transfer flavoprotein alpha/beta-subunit [Pseudopedobacter saltans DSM 12145]
MKILVCISNVPDTTTKITFTDNNTKFNDNGVQFIINPYDEIALAKAIELAESNNGEVTVIHVGEASADATIRKALAIGAHRAVRINATPIDAYFVAKEISQYAKANAFDLILTGKESIDYNGSLVAGMLGELLDMPSFAAIKKLDLDGNQATVEREIEGGKEVIALPLPFVAGTSEGVAEPKIPNMRGIMSARTKPLEVVETDSIEGLTTILRYETPPPRGTVKLINANEAEKLISILHHEAKVI